MIAIIAFFVLTVVHTTAMIVSWILSKLIIVALIGIIIYILLNTNRK